MTREEAKNWLHKLYLAEADITEEYGDMEDMKPYEEAVDMAIQALSAEPCEDAISRHDAIHLADELKDDLPDDEQMADMVTAHNEGILEYQTKLSLLPPVTPKQKIGHWVKVTNGRGGHECDVCRNYAPSYKNGDEWLTQYCPNCSAKMEEGNGWND